MLFRSTLYVNGVSLGYNGSDTTNYATNSNYFIGADANAGWYFPGYITNLRAVKGTALYTTTFKPSAIPLTNVTNTSLLLAVLSSGAATTDTSTNAFTVTNSGTVTYDSTTTPYPF